MKLKDLIYVINDNISVIFVDYNTNHLLYLNEESDYENYHIISYSLDKEKNILILKVKEY